MPKVTINFKFFFFSGKGIYRINSYCGGRLVEHSSYFNGARKAISLASGKIRQSDFIEILSISKNGKSRKIANLTQA